MTRNNKNDDVGKNFDWRVGGGLGWWEKVAERKPGEEEGLVLIKFT